MLRRRNSNLEKTMTVTHAKSQAEKTSEILLKNPKNESTSDSYAHQVAPTSQGNHEGHVLIGKGIMIKGEIRECREIEIYGTVEGDLETKVLIVHGTGLVKGNVSADSAEVHGSIDGDVNVKNRLDVKAKGSVAGTTEYGEISVEAGGRVVGTLDTQRADKDPAVVTTSQKSAAIPLHTGDKPVVASSIGTQPALN